MPSAGNRPRKPEETMALAMLLNIIILVLIVWGIFAVIKGGK
jgi:hypothetical protein